MTILIRGKVLSNKVIDNTYGSAWVRLDMVCIGDLWHTPNFLLETNREKGISKIRPILEITYYHKDEEYSLVRDLKRDKGQVEITLDRSKLFVHNNHRFKLDKKTGALDLFIKVLGNRSAIPLIEDIGLSRLSNGCISTTVSSYKLIEILMELDIKSNILELERTA